MEINTKFANTKSIVYPVVSENVNSVVVGIVPGTTGIVGGATYSCCPADGTLVWQLPTVKVATSTSVISSSPYSLSSW